MTEDPTRDLTAADMLRMVLAEVRDVRARLSAVETGLATLQATVDDRLKDTRPMWQAIGARTERIEENQKEAANRLDRIERQLRVLTQDVMAVRTDQQRIEDRMDELERRPN